MPSLGADMEAGTLVEWLKRPGDRVRRGDIVAVVETEKGAIEVDIFEEGVIERWLVEPGATVPVGTPLALIADALAAARNGGRGGAGAAAAAPAVPPAPPPPPAPRIGAGRPRVSPAARKLAAERGVDSRSAEGERPGRHDRLCRRLVGGRGARVRPRQSASTSPRCAAPIAAAMARSKREIPHYYLSTTIALTKSLAWLEETNAARPPAQRLLLAALLLKAVACALREAPEFNGFFTAEGFRPGTGVHIGTAIAIRGGGLVAPAIRDTDKLSLDELMARLRDLVARVRTGALRSSELSDPTITVTNLGERGVEAVFGVIYPPQVALVGFGTPVERPWVVDGEVVAAARC